MLKAFANEIFKYLNFSQFDPSFAGIKQKNFLKATFKNLTQQEDKASIAILKLIAQQNGKMASQLVGKYPIKDQQVLVEIATLAANQDPLNYS